MNTQKTLPKFESVTSITSERINKFYGVLVILILVFYIILLGSISIFLTLIGIIIIAYSLIKNKNYITIIDDQGIHYVDEFGNDVDDVIGWKSFEKIEKFTGNLWELPYSNNHDYLNYDVFPGFTGSGRVSRLTLFCFIQKLEKVKVYKETFYGEHAFNSFYNNRLELSRAFLLGLAHFRPDITIHPDVFSFYLINPDTYIFENEVKDQGKDKGLLLSLAGLVALIIFFIMLFLFFR